MVNRNPMLDQLSQPPAVQSGAINPNTQMLEAFAKFKQQMAGKDPRAEVERLLREGIMTQPQFEELKRQAVLLSKILR